MSMTLDVRGAILFNREGEEPEFGFMVFNEKLAEGDGLEVLKKLTELSKTGFYATKVDIFGDLDCIETKTVRVPAHRPPKPTFAQLLWLFTRVYFGVLGFGVFMGIFVGHYIFGLDLK